MKRISFIQDTGIFCFSIIIMISPDEDHKKRFYKKLKILPDIKKIIDEDYKHFSKKSSKSEATTYFNEGKVGAIMFRKFSDELLVHELMHVVDDLSDDRGFEEEKEARAYLIQYLFRNIKRELKNCS